MTQPIRMEGHLGRDPELRFTPAGKPVASFSLATYAGHDAGGEKQTEWVEVTVWGDLAELVNRSLKSGSFVKIAGTLKHPRPYKSDKGRGVEITLNKESGHVDCRWEVTAWEVNILPEKRQFVPLEQAARGGGNGSGSVVEAEAAIAPGVAPGDVDPVDVPF